METETDRVNDEGGNKKHRQRKKQLYKSIREQMEFYFSDSNLTKERFLNELLSKSEYVDLSVFLKFNKIRKLTNNLDDIVKSLKKSEFLKLSEDCTSIKRITPVNLRDNVDDCTIYVENIQSDTTHDLLKDLFSEFGNVLYVSIPKYRHNKLNKGFAFIEFETEDDTKKTIEYFESINCRINSQMGPEQLSSIKTFGEEEKMNVQEEGEDNNAENNEKCLKKENDMICEENTGDDTRNKNKRKLVDEENNVDKDVKKIKIETAEEKVDDIEEAKIDDSAKVDNIETAVEIKEEKVEEEQPKKKRKKSKKKTLIKEMGLQVLPKNEWKKMRNRYLDMQRNKMKQLKQHLTRVRFNNKHEDRNNKYEDRNNKYDDRNTNKKVQKEIKETRLEFIPGVIVKLTLSEGCTDIKKTKKEIKSKSADIEFVEIPPSVNNDEIFVRFSNNKSATDFCTNASGKGVVLEGEDEKLYWEKIKSTRDIKYKREARKNRGRDKLLKKAERELGKHIIFDNDDIE